MLFLRSTDFLRLSGETGRASRPCSRKALVSDSAQLRQIAQERRTVQGIGRFLLMSIDPLTGVIVVSLVVALLCHLWPPPPDDHNGPGETAP